MAQISEMCSFERGRAIRRHLAHTTTDSCNQQKKEEGDSRVQLVSSDQAFRITSDWAGILRRCSVMTGVGLSVLFLCVAANVCLSEWGRMYECLCKSKSQVEPRRHERSSSVETSSLTSQRLKCEPENIVMEYYYYFCVFFAESIRTFSCSLSLVFSLWTAELGFLTLSGFVDLFSVCFRTWQKDLTCFTSSIRMKYFTGQWFWFWPVVFVDMRLTVENIT